MAKTLNQFLEGYLKVKNPDEQKFVDKHVVAKHADRNGNGDEVFKGSKVKMDDRRKSRHGYNPGEDEKVYEELKGSQHKIDANKNGKLDAHDFQLLRKKKKVAEEAEELEELSTPTLQGYRKKARAQGNAIVDKMKMGGGDWSKDQKDTQTLRKRSKGANMSGKQLVKRGESLKTEEAEQIDELSKETKASYMKKAGAEINKHWDNSQKDARSAYKYYGRKNTMKKIANEEAEQIDELDFKLGGTLSRYINKTKGDPKREAGRNLALSKRGGDTKYGTPEPKVKAAVREEIEELDETAKIVAHLQKRYGDNIRKSHVVSAANDFGVDASKLAKAVRTKLGKNMLGEKLNMDKASMGDVITDFKDSNAPQFKGKSQDKRRAMAIAAKLTAERGGKPLRKEEKLADLLGDLTETHRRTMLSVFDKLNEDNQKKFLEACETPDGVESMLDFSISHRGE